MMNPLGPARGIVIGTLIGGALGLFFFAALFAATGSPTLGAGCMVAATICCVLALAAGFNA